MKYLKTTFILLLLVTFILVTAHIAEADRSGSWGGSNLATFIEVDNNAPGTKVDTTLTVHYVDTGGSGCFGDIETQMVFFMRAKIGGSTNEKGNDYVVFHGQSSETVCYFDDDAQQAIIENYIASVVVPALFCETPNAPSAIKSVSQVGEDAEFLYPGSTDGQMVTIMDMTIAVQEAAVDKIACPPPF